MTELQRTYRAVCMPATHWILSYLVRLEHTALHR